MLSVTLRVSIKPFSANAASEFTHSLYLSNTFCTFKDTAAQLPLCGIPVRQKIFVSFII